MNWCGTEYEVANGFEVSNVKIHESGNLSCRDYVFSSMPGRETQSTHLYTLDEFKPRADLDLEKGYLNGRFGAIPFLARFNELNWE